MNKFYLKTLLLCLLSFIGITSSAYSDYDCEVNGVYYNLDKTNKTASVTYKSCHSASMMDGDYYDRYNEDYTPTTVTIPSSITVGSDKYTVTSIGDYAFRDCSNLTSVTIPNSVTSIGYTAFRGCGGLEKVIVPDLAAWYRISFVDIYSNPLCYAHHLYCDENTEITDLIIPNSVTEIGNYAFAGCSGLTSVTIPNSVTSIGSSAFYFCSGLEKVIVPDLAAWCRITFVRDLFNSSNPSNPLQYAKHLYSDENTEITDLIIPDGVTEIGSSAFYGCSGLTSVEIPNSVTEIGGSAFAYCSGLTSVTIPNSVTSIDGAFYCCSGLTSVEIPNSVTEIGGSAFAGCSGLTSVEIPNSVTEIGGFAFENCSGLTSVTIGNSVTVIGASAFEGCSRLTSMTIPNSVTSIGNCAFGCSNLTSIVSLIQEPSDINLDAFGYFYWNADVGGGGTSNLIYYNATLYVPEGTADKYRAIKGWKRFANIVEGDPSSIIFLGNEESVPTETERYTINGKRIATPQRGINVVKMSDGTVKKVLVK